MSATGAGAAPAPMAAMPQQFAVESLTIRLSRQNGNAAYAPLLIELSGASGGALSQGGQRWPFAYPPQALVTLLDGLYAVGFFELPGQLGSRTGVQLGPDGKVQQIGKAASSSSGNSVCVNVAAFEKCVRYGAQAPVELLQWVQGVFAEAQRLTGKP